MKKIIFAMLAMTMAAFTFTSCEDVPEPYEIPGGEVGGGTVTDNGTYLDQSFASSLGEFTQKGSNDNIAWIIDYSSACITGYKDYDGDGQKENQAGVTYLVSPEIDLENSTEAYISINHALNYEKADINANNSVLISKDYNGDVDAATWEALAYNTDGLGSSFTFVTKNINIPAGYIGGKVRIALRHTCSDKQSSTWEVKELSVKEGTAGEDNKPDTGDSSKENPYTVAQAIANNSGNAWVKGYIVGWIDGQVLAEGARFNGSATVKTNLLIADDANETDLAKCMPVQLPTGDVRTALNLQDNPQNYKQEVILSGSLEKYFGTAGLKSVTEFVLNNGGGVTPPPAEGTPTGDGTVDNPFNSVAANQLAASLGNGDTTDKDYYIKGKVVSIKENFNTTQYGNATFYISDDGTAADQFYVFRALYLNNEKYTGGDVLTVGDEVVVCGKLTNYMGNTPETVQNQAYIYSWTKNGGGNTGNENNPGGEVTENSITVVASAFGLENGKEVGTQTLADGTVITFAGGGNTNTPKYYNTGTNIRMYPKNSMTIKSSKAIASVIINCDEVSGVICNASGDVKAEPGTVNTSEKVINIGNINSQQTVITNTSGTTGTASQIRMVSFTINYAK